jgi:transcription initiation factor IIE alpha subunit
MTAKELLREIVDEMSEDEAQRLLELYQSEDEEFSEEEIAEILKAREEMLAEGGVSWDEVRGKLHL